MAERLHHRRLWTWKVYTILKSHAEILLEGNSGLCYSNTEIFPQAGKVSKLQKISECQKVVSQQ